MKSKKGNVLVAGSTMSGLKARRKAARSLLDKLQELGFRRIMTVKEDRFGKTLRILARSGYDFKLRTRSVKDEVHEDAEEMALAHFIWDTDYVVGVWDGSKRCFAKSALEMAMRMKKSYRYIEV